MSKQKLLITTDSFLPRIDGVARFLMEMIPLLSEHFTITVVAPDFPGQKVQIKNVSFVYIPLSSWKVGDYQFAQWKPRILKKLIKANDIIFNQTLGTIGMNAIRIAHKQKKPVVSFIHSIDWELASKSLGGISFVQDVVKRIAKHYYKKCTKLFFPAQQAQLKYEEQGIVRPSVIIPLGVDPNRFKPSHSKPMAKRKIGIDATRLVIGFCGRIGREKDLWTLKKAFENVQKKGKVVLLIVGKGIPDIRLEGEGVIMAGQQEDVVPYLQAMDIYVLPSLTETTSLSTLEAMACALPVICTPVGAIKTYIKHRENGFLFPRGNVEKLTQYLMVLLKKPKRREELGLAARKTVKEQFHWENTAERIKHSLKNLL